jgi:hypothetical protein
MSYSQRATDRPRKVEQKSWKSEEGRVDQRYKVEQKNEANQVAGLELRRT